MEVEVDMSNVCMCGQQTVGSFSVLLLSTQYSGVYWSGWESGLFSKSLCFYLSLNP